MTSIETLIVMLLIGASAYLSALEISIFSLSKQQLRQIKDTFGFAYKRVKKLLADPPGILFSILILNEVINVSISAMLTKFSTSLYEVMRIDTLHNYIPFIPEWVLQTLIGTLITGPIVLIVCEVTPKTFATRANLVLATMASRPLEFIYDLLSPLRQVFSTIASRAGRTTKIVFALPGRLRIFKRREFRRTPRSSVHEGSQSMVPSPSASTTTSDIQELEPGASGDILKESEFIMMVEEGHKEGAIQGSELELIKNVFELDDTPVSRIMTPIHEVTKLPGTCTVRNAMQELMKSRYSRIPVHGKKQNEIIGILYAKDLLSARLKPTLLDQPVTSVLRKGYRVSRLLQANILFRRFKQQRTHMALVVNERDEVVGIVTMDDIFDLLLEEEE